MKKSAGKVPDPTRPLCTCGQPGVFQVHIDVQELVLDRDAGISSRPYWQLQVVATAKIEKVPGG